MQLMTYEEAGARFGISPEAMRKRVYRLGWKLHPPNAPGGKTRIEVPEDAVIRPPKPPEDTASPPADRLPDILRLIEEAGALRERAAKAEGEAAVLREALAREGARADGERKAAEEARAAAQAAEAARATLEAELRAWTAGGPLARAWRAFSSRRG